ncbi:MAG: helix-turn-helix transcriptional regulator [Lachnospiraceae bacterium]|nr:helix-turn-helix transcriptional regulator [Lachnospiraceae bacterium]
MDIGAQIRELREKQNIPLEELALGICTVESLRNIELGKEVVNKLFMEIMFQRLGKSTDKLELIVSEEVYEEEELKDSFEECLERGDKDKAEEILSYFRKNASEDSNVHKMFYYRSMAYAEFRLKQNSVKAKEWLQKALDLTIPGWRERPLESFWISNIEVENLLAYVKMQLETGTEGTLNSAEEFLLNCRNYIDRKITDGEEHAKIFAKCAWLLAGVYLRRGERIRAEQLAEKAFQELQAYGISYFMEPLLETLIQCSEDKMMNRPPYQRYLTALQHVKEYVGETRRFIDSIFKNCSQQTYYLDYELFREERIAQGYSQEQMIEGVYKNPESLSRAERGKVTMRDSKLIRLFRRLGIEKCRYNGFLVTDDYAVLELKQEVDILLSRNCFEEAEEKIEELKSRLDLNVSENRRTIAGYEINIGIVKKAEEKELLLQKATDLLQETYRLKEKGVYRSPMDREVELINVIGILLCQMGRKEEAIQLFDMAAEMMKKSKVSIQKRYRTYTLLRSNLAKWLSSVSVAKENLEFTVVCGKLRSLPINYMIIACAMIDIPANWEICRDMIKDSYYLCELSCNNVNKEITSQYYEKKFGAMVNED